MTQKTESNNAAAPAARAKTCFVLMPLSPSVAGYAPNHFAEVFTHIISPACETAGYKAEVASDNAASELIMAGILRRIVDADMVLCDMSSRNPNVFYELALRQAFGKPVVLVRDERTQEPFDVQGLRYVRYSSALRVTEVPADRDRIATCISETAKGQGVSNLMDLIGMQPANLGAAKTVAPETMAILNALQDVASRLSGLEARQISSGYPFVPISSESVPRIGLLGQPLPFSFSEPSGNTLSEILSNANKRGAP